jgi:hypothetical protein
VIEGDITRPETVERILGTAAERFGRIDTLVNNAGVFIAKPFTEYSEKDFATISGHIVNITTTIAEQPVASLPAALAALKAERDHALARDRICQPSRSGERRLAGRDQDADAFAGHA